MELLEREHFREMLNTGFQKAVSGEGHIFLINGEAGIGKSSLARAFLQEVENRCNIYSSLCDSLFSPRPLGPVYDLALQIDQHLAAINRSPDDRILLFARIVQSFAQQSRAVVVLIEDIHWADEATLDFIKYFARRIRQGRCLLLLTYRDNEVTPEHPLRHVVGELLPGSFTRMQLPPLSKSTVQELAAKKGYNGEDLFNVSGGNPFYVTEILSSYSPGLPDNIRDSILSIFNKGNEVTRNAWQLLGIVPEGLDCEWMPTFDAQFPEAIESCLSQGIIIIRQNRIHFKHELYRRTMEASLSPFRRLQLNKKIIELFLPYFEEQGAIERIVHYAKNAGERNLVSKYAPQAAQQAASVGAHTEAAKLYLVAIKYDDHEDPARLIRLYEAYSYECYLSNQVEEAIIYQAKALKMQQLNGDKTQVGNSLRILSRLSWFAGQRKEAEEYGLRSVEIFSDQELSKAKTMAWSNMAQLKMLADEAEEAVKWGMLAIGMANEDGDMETLCHALNNVGSAEARVAATAEAGRKKLTESLSLALQHSFHEHAARAYTNLIAIAINDRDYEMTHDYLDKGLNYCEERDLHSWRAYIQSWKARMLLETGNWQQALDIAMALGSYSGQPAIVKITIALVQATVAVRTGKGEALGLLQEAVRMAFETKEHQRIIPVAIAGMEYEWIKAKPVFTAAEMETIFALIERTKNASLNLQAAYWIHKARPNEPGARTLFAKYFQQKNSDPELAAAYQRWSQCPYEKALLLFEGSAEEKRRAIAALRELGADLICEKLISEMRSSGIRNIPRGMRASTKANPAQLTSRELDILQLLKTGAPNKEIAASLFISPKTVDHHISSILFKLDVPSRAKAVKEAEILGILK